MAILTHLGPSYIRPNQSCLYSYEHRQKQVKEEHQNIMNTITAYLVRVYHMPNTSVIIKQFSQQLATYLHDRYMSSNILSEYKSCSKRKKDNQVNSI